MFTDFQTTPHQLPKFFIALLTVIITEHRRYPVRISRIQIFMMIAMLTLPAVLGVNGIWLATPVAELMALAITGGMFVKYRKRYQYGAMLCLMALTSLTLCTTSNSLALPEIP